MFDCFGCCIDLLSDFDEVNVHGAKNDKMDITFSMTLLNDCCFCMPSVSSKPNM